MSKVSELQRKVLVEGMDKKSMEKMREKYKDKEIEGVVDSYDAKKMEGMIKFKDEEMGDVKMKFDKDSIKDKEMPEAGMKAKFKMDDKYTEGLRIKEMSCGGVSEEFDVEGAIKALIDTNFSADDKAQGKASNIMKGLLFSDDPKAKAFVKKLDKMLSGMKA